MNRNKELQFPLEFNIRIIMLIKDSIDKNIEILEAIFTNLDIERSEWKSKQKENSKYTVLSNTINLETRDVMEMLYKKLKQEPLVKMAL